MPRVDSYPEPFLARVQADFLASGQDVEDRAGQLSRSRRIASSGRVEQLGPGEIRVIFTAPFAKARERGAFIRPRAGRTGRGGRRAVLKFADGSFRPFARLRKHPYLQPAGAMWSTFLAARLRGSSGRGGAG